MKQVLKKATICCLLITMLVCTSCSYDHANYGEFNMVYDADYLRLDQPEMIAEGIERCVQQYQGFVGTIVPIEHRFYHVLEYDEGKEDYNGWWMTGYAEIVCEITEISEEYNETSYQVGDRIILHEDIFLQPRCEDFDEYRPLASQIGMLHDAETGYPAPPSEEELQILKQEGSLRREYLVPTKIVNASNFRLLIHSQVGFLLPKTAYDVVIMKGGFGYTAYYAAAQEGNPMKENDNPILEACTDGFAAYLAEHRAELGLADVAVKK